MFEAENGAHHRLGLQFSAQVVRQYPAVIARSLDPALYTALRTFPNVRCPPAPGGIDPAPIRIRGSNPAGSISVEFARLGSDLEYAGSKGLRPVDAISSRSWGTCYRNRGRARSRAGRLGSGLRLSLDTGVKLRSLRRCRSHNSGTRRNRHGAYSLRHGDHQVSGVPERSGRCGRLPRRLGYPNGRGTDRNRADSRDHGRPHCQDRAVRPVRSPARRDGRRRCGPVPDVRFRRNAGASARSRHGGRGNRSYSLPVSFGGPLEHETPRRSDADTHPGLALAVGEPGVPSYRTARKNFVTSSTNSSGSSIAAKCPPRGISVH